MVDPRNPQAAQMADESMVRTLAAQIEAIWPQESRLLDRYRLPAGGRVLDVGCGTGEFSRRVAERYCDCEVLGVDILASSIAHASARHRALAPRLRFAVDDAFALTQPAGSFDLVACRHVLQAIPDAPRAIGQLVRAARPGGWVHVLSEDYGMLHMMSGPRDPDRLWREGPVAYGQRTGTDTRIGRRTWSLLRAWRDGYAEPMAAGSSLSAAEFRAHFDEVIASIRDPDHYAVWMVPVIGGRKPS